MMQKHLSAFSFLLLLFVSTINCNSQILKPATWSYKLSKPTVEVGQSVDIIFEASIQDDWYLYSSDFDPNLGPIVTTFNFEPSKSYSLVGKVKAIGAKKKYDDIWGGEYTYFKHKGLFKQTVKILKPNAVVKGTYNYQVCTEADGRCVGGNGEFELKNFAIASSSNSLEKPNPGSVETSAIDANTSSLIDSSLKPELVSTPKLPTEKITLKERGDGTNENKSLIYFMFVAFLAGIASLLTPCVFPMIPMTVTFFTNTSKNRRQSTIKALVYGFSIILIYTLIGVIAARINGPAFANFISTHWIPNLLFTIIFAVFALSFLGLFDITLPSSFVNKVDKEADKGGYYGVFFMAFTIVLVSFSCTGPIVGSILVEAAGGHLLKPILGMLAYSAAFAIPFTLFAIFPEWLHALPKSGGWLNVVKVTLGFIELAMAIKFLSVADQVEHWGLLDREIYLSIWIVIFLLLGLYLLGKIRLPHDSPVEKIGVTRLLMATVSFIFAVYMIPGLWGAPLKALSGYLPPMTTQDFNLYDVNRELGTISKTSELCTAPSHADKLELPHRLKGYFNYKEALACAKANNKPLFIDFTGHGCVNCRKMEANVWSDPRVLKLLNEKYTVVALYVDDPTELPESEWVTSTFDGKIKKTIGAVNGDIQITKFDNNAQPYYILLDPNTETKLAQPVAFNENVEEFINFLEEGVKNYKVLNAIP